MSRRDVRVESPSIRINRRGTVRKLNFGALAAVLLACPLGIALDGHGFPQASLAASLLHALAVLLMLSPMALLIASAVTALISPRSRPGTASIDGATFRIDREGQRPITVPLAKVREGYLNEYGPRGEAHITLPNGNVVEMSVEDAKNGESLLEAAGLDATQRRMTIKLRRIFYSLMYWMFAPATLIFSSIATANALAARFGVGGASSAPVLGGLILGVALSILAGRRLLGPDITIGSDGVVIRGPIGARFIPYGEMTKVQLRYDKIWFDRRDGTTTSVWAKSDSDPSPFVVVERIEQAREAFARGADSGEGARALAREGRSIETWRKEIVAAIDRVGGYRDTALTRESLRKVVADVSAGIEQRIGAALALGASDNEEDRERVRVVAEASASAPIRVALERAGKGTIDDGEVEAAIAAERKA